MSSEIKQTWIFIDRRDERLFDIGLKSLSRACALSRLENTTTVAIILGGDSGGCIDVDPACSTLVENGADFILVLSGERLAAEEPDLCARSLAKLAEERHPAYILFPLTDLGKETAARTARLMDAGLIADAESFHKDGNRLVADCPAWGGEVVAGIYFADSSRSGLMTVGTHGAADKPGKGDPGKIEHVETGTFDSKGLKLISSQLVPSEHMRLEDADIVVAGGAGLGSLEGFSLVRDLAAALGGEVGATRPAVNNHWASEERLIGQTGKSVRPNLMITIGTSGAIQYTAGIKGAKKIVAINRDPDAPVFKDSDIGIVADAKSLLPCLTDKARKAVMRRLADMIGAECVTAEGGVESFGAKVRRIREAHGMSIDDVAGATGKDPEFITDVESGNETPSVGFLLRLAKGVGVDPSAFLTDSEQQTIRDERAQQFTTRTKNYSYQTLTPGAENEHLRAFMITIEPRQAHKPVAYKHEGEEFVYVLEGELELTLGSKVHHLKPGESQHFDSEVPHKLKSLSDDPTQCLVMLYTP